jgi:pimeloyl-ACP methyl ester carboxylesterase
MAADAISFIEGLDLPIIDLLGHSMGGEVAQVIALRRPELVRRLVLVGTGPRGGVLQEPEVAALFAKRDHLGDDMWLPIMFWPSQKSQAAGRAFLDRIHVRTDDRDVLADAETIAAHRAAAREWGTPAEGSFDYLARIAQPTLVVNGNNDIVIPTINSYTRYQHLPHAELMLLPDANHGAHFQYPALFARRVIDFLDVEPNDFA